MIYFYEATDIEKGECIYFGSNREELVKRLHHHMVSQHDLDLGDQTIKELNDLNEPFLSIFGIEVIYQ
ncbi:hypothetical protein AMD01_05040 [Priestia koreensis]|uniref:Uncharacterized protein n=1 Tax=Priestia koreensis TaxID=284581 RepID=A0A0M0LBW2_9BACI|nr:hypothetical protein AMD01_05040 [Priestia koreensis]